VAEKIGDVIMTPARCAINAANLPEFLWPWAEEAAVQVLNLLPTESNPGCESPHSRFYNYLKLHDEARKDYSLHVVTFGCEVWVHDRKEAQSRKMTPRAVKGYFVGFRDRRAKIYKVWIPTKHHVVDARDVRVNEKFFIKGGGTLEEPDYIAQIKEPSYEDFSQFRVFMQDEPTQPTPLQPSSHPLPDPTLLPSLEPQPIEGQKDQPGPRTPPSTREGTPAGIPHHQHHEDRDDLTQVTDTGEHTDEPDDDNTFEDAMNEIIAEGPLRLGTPIPEPKDEVKQSVQPSSRPKRSTSSHRRCLVDNGVRRFATI